MNTGVNLYALPPSVVALETIRKRNDRALVGYLLMMAAGFIGLALDFFDPQRLAHLLPAVLESSLSILLIMVIIYSLIRLVGLSRRMIKIGETGPETLEAILCSEVATVTAYCTAVKNQGRMLTMDEAEALMTLCMHPDVFKKIVASYDRHDEAHPFSGFNC